MASSASTSNRNDTTNSTSPSSTPKSIPSGLELLLNTNKLLVCYKTSCCSSDNALTVTNHNHENIFVGTRNERCVVKYCCFSTEQLEVTITDLQGRCVIFLKHTEVRDGSGALLGSFKDADACCNDTWEVNGPSGEVLLYLEATSFCGNDINILAVDRSRKIGKICISSYCCCLNCASQQHIFIIWPPDLDIRSKAVLLAAAFGVPFYRNQF